MKELIDSFVAAYEPHVAQRCRELGFELPAVAVDRGREWLRSELSSLLEQPFPEQRRGPLELFQEAMSFPTQALAERGLEPVVRSPVAEAALPGDLFDLAPASSSELGEDAWRAHLQWGAAKARAMGDR